MYNYGAADILDGVSNIYLVSIATAFLAVIIAFYCSNFLKDESEKQQNCVLEETGEEELVEENYVQSDTSTESEIDKHHLKDQTERRYDECNSDDDDDGGNDTTYIGYAKRNSSTDDDTDDEDMHSDGLVGKLKSKRVKDLEARLTREQLEEERRIEREQLTAIFELLKRQEAELNMKEINESELNAQLSLYR